MLMNAILTVTPTVTGGRMDLDGSIVEPHTLSVCAVLSDRPRQGGAVAFGGSISVATLYRYYDNWGSLLYVGITRAGIARGFDHAAGAPWWHLVAYAEFDEVSQNGAAFAEKLAIWTERPLFNIAKRMPTDRRQRMRAEVLKHDPLELIHHQRTMAILGWKYGDLCAAVRWGFIKTDYPRAMWLTRDQLLDFIGESDPGPADVNRIVGHGRDTLTARLNGLDPNRRRAVA
jgi:hypothetical protein